MDQTAKPMPPALYDEHPPASTKDLIAPQHKKQDPPPQQEIPLDQRAKNHLRFAVSMCFIQIAVAAVYGTSVQIIIDKIDILSVVITITMALGVIAGMGLWIGYVKRLVWSGLGFSFLIAALSIELYPLFNAIWIKVHLIQSATPSTTYNLTKSVYLFLASNNDQFQTSSSITGGLKCGLSLIIAFSAIIGRAGPLEAVIISLVGSLGFSLNRALVQRIGKDAIGSGWIFGFGGAMALVIGALLCRRQEKAEASTVRNRCYAGSNFSVTTASIGTMLIFILFPILAYDHDTIQDESGSTTIAPVIVGNLILAMCTSFLVSCSIATLFSYSLHRICPRDAIMSVMAGGVAMGIGSLHCAVPGFAMIVGFLAGAMQTIVQHVGETKKWMQEGKPVICTTSWTVFVLQSFLGGIAASIFCAISKSHPNGLTYSSQILQVSAIYQILSIIVSLALGAIFGLIAGIPITYVNDYKKSEFFQDGMEWLDDDGLQGMRKTKRLRMVLKGDFKFLDFFQTVTDPVK